MNNNPFFYFEHTSHPLQEGKILISAPLPRDIYFNRTIVLLVEHNQEGSFGIVLNRKLGITLKDVFKHNKKQKSIPIFHGGPVDMSNLFVLHSYGDLIEGSSHLIEDVYFGGLPSELLMSINDDVLDENLIRFFLGYAGWTKGQLESELEKKMWVVGQFQEKLLFHNDDETCWRMAVESLGKQYLSWLNIVKEPYLN